MCTKMSNPYLEQTPTQNFRAKQEYVLWSAVSVSLLQIYRYGDLLSLTFIHVATLTLWLHDVIGHVTTLFDFITALC